VRKESLMPKWMENVALWVSERALDLVLGPPYDYKIWDLEEEDLP
jgi:hypothetical protein